MCHSVGVSRDLPGGVAYLPRREVDGEIRGFNRGLVRDGRSAPGGGTDAGE